MNFDLRNFCVLRTRTWHGLGSNLCMAGCLGVGWVELACSPCVCVGSLRVLSMYYYRVNW